MQYIQLTHTRSQRKLHVVADRITAMRETDEGTLLFTGSQGQYVDESVDFIKIVQKQALEIEANINRVGNEGDIKKTTLPRYFASWN